MSTRIRADKDLRNGDFLGNPYFFLIFIKTGSTSIFNLKIIIERIKKQKQHFEVNLIQEEKEISDYFLNFDGFSFYRIIFFVGFKGECNIETLIKKSSNFTLNIFFFDYSDQFFLSSFLTKRTNLIKRTSALKTFFCNTWVEKWQGLLDNFLRVPNNEKPEIFPLSDKLESSECFRVIWLKSLKTTNLFFRKKIGKKRYTQAMVLLKNKFLELKKLEKTEFLPSKRSTGIQVEEELNFKEDEIPIDLITHWTILESFINFPFFAVKMKIWKRDGIKTLSSLFFRMGLSVQKIKKKWTNLEDDVKKNFRKNLNSECKKLALDFKEIECSVIFFGNHMKGGDFSSLEISSFDFILAINFLLDMKVKNLENDKSKKSFWEGYEAISDPCKIKIGINKTKKARKMMVKMARLILNKKTYTSDNEFRCIHIKQNENLTLGILKELIFFLNGAFKEMGLKRKTTILLSHRGTMALALVFFHDQIRKKKTLNYLNVMKKDNCGRFLIENSLFLAFFLEKKTTNWLLNKLTE